jgi:hypothetical protein
LLGRLGKLAQDNGCIFFKNGKKSLPGNIKFNLATLRPIRNNTRNFVILSRSKSQKNQTSSQI